MTKHFSTSNQIKQVLLYFYGISSSTYEHFCTTLVLIFKHKIRRKWKSFGLVSVSLVPVEFLVTFYSSRYRMIPNKSKYPNKCMFLKDLDILIMWVFKTSLFLRYSCLKFCLYNVCYWGFYVTVWTAIFNSQYLWN